MPITREDFEIISGTLRDYAMHRMSAVHYADLCIRFSAELGKIYPTFNKERFLEACFMQDGKAHSSGEVSDLRAD